MKLELRDRIQAAIFAYGTGLARPGAPYAQSECSPVNQSDQPGWAAQTFATCRLQGKACAHRNDVVSMDRDPIEASRLVHGRRQLEILRARRHGARGRLASGPAN